MPTVQTPPYKRYSVSQLTLVPRSGHQVPQVMSLAVKVALGQSMPGIGSQVGVRVGVSVGVSVGVKVSVGVAVCVGVSVDVAVGVKVGVEIGVSVGVGVSVAFGGKMLPHPDNTNAATKPNITIIKITLGRYFMNRIQQVSMERPGQAAGYQSNNNSHKHHNR